MSESPYAIRRLGRDDVDAARALFALMAEVFEEPADELAPPYVERLLSRREFWVLAAFREEQIVGGITAHTLPMTRAEVSELFIYDLAVRPDDQRRGVARALVGKLCEAAAAEGIHVAFVPADNEDAGAIAFYRALDAAEAPVTIFEVTTP